MWVGRFTFGEGWAVYRGRTDVNTPHRHVAIQIATGADGDIAMRCDGGELRARAIAVPSMMRHDFLKASGEVMALYIEAELPLGRALRRHLGIEIAPLPDGLAAELSMSSPEGAVAALADFLGVAETASPDLRLVAALAFLRVCPGEPGAVGAAAKAAGLSAARLRELAQVELGVALSQWLLWQKLGRASRAIAAGASLSEAAASGGFSDQAHFSRTMRRMFGVTPGIAAETLC